MQRGRSWRSITALCRCDRGDFAFWMQPVPGDESDLIWMEVHDYAALPKVVNPARGWVQNSNSAPWYMTQPFLDPDQFPAYMAPHTMLTREQRSQQMLTDQAQMSMADVIEAKYSTYSQVADQLLDDLVAAARASEDESVQAAAPVLAAWHAALIRTARVACSLPSGFKIGCSKQVAKWMAAHPDQAPSEELLISDIFYAIPWDPPGTTDNTTWSGRSGTRHRRVAWCGGATATTGRGAGYTLGRGGALTA